MNYEHQKTCPGCFKSLLWNGLCSKCGYNVNDKKNLLALEEHTILAGKYVIGKVLGIGGFGITYLGLDLSLNKIVAIKEYLPRDIAGREPNSKTVKPYTHKEDEFYRYGLEKFIEEARTLAKFDHPNIVRVREVFQENDTCYIVMDYYEGMTLDEYIEKKGGKVNEEETLKIIMPILDGLKVVHNENVLHRDIKPQNIYITKDGRSILIDFGSARTEMGHRSRSMSVILTPGYAPYEQYQSNSEQGPWTDIYAIAATMYYMLTGVIPPDSVERRDKDELIQPKFLNTTISENTNNAVIKALAVDYRERQKSIEEFQNMLFGKLSIGKGYEMIKNDSTTVHIPRIEKKKINIQESILKNKKIKVVGIILLFITISLIILLPKYLEQKKLSKIDTHIKSGEKLIKEKRYDQAIEEFTAAIHLDPDNSRAYYGRGVSYKQKKSYDEAIIDLNRALKLNSDNKEIQSTLAKTHIERGFNYLDVKKYDSAIADFENTLQMTSDKLIHSVAYLGIGIGLAEKGNHNEAINYYNKAVNLDSENKISSNPDFYWYRGYSYSAIGYYNLAIDDFTKAIQLKPDYSSAYNNRGVCFAKKGLYEYAISDYSKACSMGDSVACNNLKNLEKYLEEKRKLENLRRRYPW